mgnify:CR=1 FL=1
MDTLVTKFALFKKDIGFIRLLANIKLRLDSFINRVKCLREKRNNSYASKIGNLG